MYLFFLSQSSLGPGCCSAIGGIYTSWGSGRAFGRVCLCHLQLLCLGIEKFFFLGSSAPRLW